MSHDIYRDGHVHVCAELCSTCVFRPGNLMQLKAGRVRDMVDEATRNDGAIVCHKTLDGESLICRGWWDRYRDRSWLVRYARHLGIIREVAPPG